MRFSCKLCTRMILKTSIWWPESNTGRPLSLQTRLSLSILELKCHHVETVHSKDSILKKLILVHYTNQKCTYLQNPQLCYMGCLPCFMLLNFPPLIKQRFSTSNLNFNIVNRFTKHQTDNCRKSLFLNKVMHNRKKKFTSYEDHIHVRSD